MWQTFEKLLSHPVSDHCLLEFFLLLSSLFLIEFLCHFAELRHILINYTACLINVSLLFLKYLLSQTNECLPEVRFKAYFTGKLQINRISN